MNSSLVESLMSHQIDSPQTYIYTSRFVSELVLSKLTLTLVNHTRIYNVNISALRVSVKLFLSGFIRLQYNNRSYAGYPRKEGVGEITANHVCFGYVSVFAN